MCSPKKKKRLSTFPKICLITRQPCMRLHLKSLKPSPKFVYGILLWHSSSTIIAGCNVFKRSPQKFSSVATSWNLAAHGSLYALVHQNLGQILLLAEWATIMRWVKTHFLIIFFKFYHLFGSPIFKTSILPVKIFVKPSFIILLQTFFHMKWELI